MTWHRFFLLKQICRPRTLTRTQPERDIVAQQAMVTSPMAGSLLNNNSSSSINFFTIEFWFVCLWTFSVTGQYNLWNTNEGDMKELVYINPVTTSIQVKKNCCLYQVSIFNYQLPIKNGQLSIIKHVYINPVPTSIQVAIDLLSCFVIRIRPSIAFFLLT